MKTKTRYGFDVDVVQQPNGHFRLSDREHCRGAKPVNAVLTHEGPQAPVLLNIPGNCPSGKNQQLTRWDKDGKKVKAADKRFLAWRNAAQSEIHLALRGRPDLPLRGRLRAKILYTPGDHILRDVPGIMDAIWHLLEHSGVIQNDAQIRELASWDENPVSGPLAGVLVELEQIAE